MLISTLKNKRKLADLHRFQPRLIEGLIILEVCACMNSTNRHIIIRIAINGVMRVWVAPRQMEAGADRIIYLAYAQP